jgi:hypothetical protein
MPNKPPKDINQLAKYVIGTRTGEGERVEPPKVDAKMKKLSDLGASKGGQSRASKLTPEERSAIAKKAAEMRWGKPLK